MSETFAGAAQEDCATDVLGGGTGLDWFFAHVTKSNQNDFVNGQASGEVTTSIEGALL